MFISSRIVGIALIIVGTGLLIWGWQMSDSLASEVSETLTGSATDAVMTRYIGGAAMLAVGIVLMFKR